MIRDKDLISLQKRIQPDKINSLGVKSGFLFYLPCGPLLRGFSFFEETGNEPEHFFRPCLVPCEKDIAFMFYNHSHNWQWIVPEHIFTRINSTGQAIDSLNIFYYQRSPAVRAKFRFRHACILYLTLNRQI